jgi:hypothetical protein
MGKPAAMLLPVDVILAAQAPVEDGQRSGKKAVKLDSAKNGGFSPQSLRALVPGRVVVRDCASGTVSTEGKRERDEWLARYDATTP